MKRPVLFDRLLCPIEETPLSALTGPNNNFPYRAARSLAHNAKMLGLLIPGPCAHCAYAGPTEMHHRSYYRPLDVTWLCHGCHMAEHGRLFRCKIVIPGSQADLDLHAKRRALENVSSKEDAA